MKYILESKEFYSVGDLVLIEYWYNSIITTVLITEINGKKIKISHDNEFSNIKNAPDEEIKSSDILQKKIL
jgi:hypothetical protein